MFDSVSDCGGVGGGAGRGGGRGALFVYIVRMSVRKIVPLSICDRNRLKFSDHTALIDMPIVSYYRSV